MILLEIDYVGKDLSTGNCIVRYKQQDADRYLEMVVGAFESSMIHRKLNKLHPTKLLTFDYMYQVLLLSDLKIERVFIHTFLNDTYYAQVIGKRYKLFGLEEVKIDCRPSDATLIALHFDVPIYASKPLLNALGRTKAQVEAERTERAERAAFDPYDDFWQNFIDID